MRREPVGVGCARVRGRMAQAVDGTLAPLEAALDRGHLEACAECRRERAGHLALLAAIRGASAPARDELEVVTARVLARLSGEVPAAPAPGWARHAGLLAAAAAGILLALLTTLGLGSPLRALDPSAVDPLLRRLPSWTDVVQGLDSLSRWVS